MKTLNETIIGMLKPNPINDKDIGYNSALIELLQMNLGGVNILFEKRKEIYKKYLFGYSTMNIKQIEELDEIVLTGNKLQAVKIHKEVTGCGLKESKDCFDAIFLLVKD
jgi:hypothetical protein